MPVGVDFLELIKKRESLSRLSLSTLCSRHLFSSRVKSSSQAFITSSCFKRSTLLAKPVRCGTKYVLDVLISNLSKADSFKSFLNKGHYFHPSTLTIFDKSVHVVPFSVFSKELFYLYFTSKRVKAFNTTSNLVPLRSITERGINHLNKLVELSLVKDSSKSVVDYCFMNYCFSCDVFSTLLSTLCLSKDVREVKIDVSLRCKETHIVSNIRVRGLFNNFNTTLKCRH